MQAEPSSSERVNVVILRAASVSLCSDRRVLDALYNLHILFGCMHLSYTWKILFVFCKKGGENETVNATPESLLLI